MAQPSQVQVHLDAILTNISVAFIQNQNNFIANKVFPIVPVNKQTNKYYTYTRPDWFRDEAQQRADATESVGSGYGLSTDSYSCDVFAIHKDVGYQTRANADEPLDLDREAVLFVTQRLLLRQEIQWVTDYFTTGVWTTDKTGVSASPSGSQFIQWSDYVNSDPLTDVENGKSTILSTTGYEANTLVLGYDVFRYLKNHPDMVDRTKYTSSAVITTELLAALFGVERVIVAKAVKATSNEGATATYAFTHGKAAWLGYVAPNPGLLTPSAGYTFAWNGVSGGLGANVGIGRIPVPLHKADRIEGEVAFDNKVVSADLGFFFASATV